MSDSEARIEAGKVIDAFSQHGMEYLYKEDIEALVTYINELEYPGASEQPAPAQPSVELVPAQRFDAVYQEFSKRLEAEGNPQPAPSRLLADEEMDIATASAVGQPYGGGDSYWLAVNALLKAQDAKSYPAGVADGRRETNEAWERAFMEIIGDEDGLYEGKAKLAGEEFVPPSEKNHPPAMPF